MKLNMYMRDNCILCDNARRELKLALEEFNGVTVEEINIDNDDALQAQYMLRIPVITHGDTIIQEGLIDFFSIYEYILQYKR